MSTTRAVTDPFAALNALIEEFRDVPFQWGVHDCCMWSATVVQRQSGIDPAARWRGTYATARGARELIKAEFGGDIENIPGAVGLNEVPVLNAHRLDIVSARFDRRGVALGVCIGSRAVFAGKDGLIFIPMTEARRAWRK